MIIEWIQTGIMLITLVVLAVRAKSEYRRGIRLDSVRRVFRYLPADPCAPGHQPDFARALNELKIHYLNDSLIMDQLKKFQDTGDNLTDLLYLLSLDFDKDGRRKRKQFERALTMPHTQKNYIESVFS